MSPSKFKLTPEQTSAVNNVRRVLSDLTYEIDIAQKCGVPGCDQMRQTQQEIQEGLAKVVQFYGQS